MAAALEAGNSPDSWQLEMRRLAARCLERLDDWQTALAERQALVDNQAAPPLDDLRALALCALHTGKYELLLQISQRLLQSLPDDLEINQLVGQATLALQDFSQAVVYYRQATQLSPERPDLWMALTRALYGAGQETQALEALCSASQAAPDSEIHLARPNYLKYNA
jgi:cytochrome c-type biogenesis protein CcmH/NrfG